MENQFPPSISATPTHFSRRCCLKTQSLEGKGWAATTWENIQPSDALEVVCGGVRKWSDISGGPKWHLQLVLLMPAAPAVLSLQVPCLPKRSCPLWGEGSFWGPALPPDPSCCRGSSSRASQAVSLVLGLRCSHELGHFCLGMAASGRSEAALQSSSQMPRYIRRESLGPQQQNKAREAKQLPKIL